MQWSPLLPSSGFCWIRSLRNLFKFLRWLFFLLIFFVLLLLFAPLRWPLFSWPSFSHFSQGRSTPFSYLWLLFRTLRFFRNSYIDLFLFFFFAFILIIGLFIRLKNLLLVFFTLWIISFLIWTKAINNFVLPDKTRRPDLLCYIERYWFFSSSRRLYFSGRFVFRVLFLAFLGLLLLFITNLLLYFLWLFNFFAS